MFNLCDSSLSSMKSSKFISGKWACEYLMNVVKSLFIRRVVSISTSSEFSDAITSWFMTEFNLSQKLDTSHAHVETLDDIKIFDRIPHFFLVGSDFVICAVTFPLLSLANDQGRMLCRSVFPIPKILVASSFL